MGWLFGGVVKELERVAKDVVRESSSEIANLFDNKLYPLADRLDYVSKQRIKDTEELESKTKADLENLLNTADEKVKGNLEEIDKLRERAIRDSKETLSQTDFYLENRINQMSLVVMEAISGIDNSLQRVEVLENQLFQDVNQIVEKIDEAIDGKLEFIKNEFKKYFTHALPAPFDQCKKKLNISWKLGGMLSDIELYELSECYELSKLHEDTPIDDVLKIYGQLQQNAYRMAALVKKSSELRNRAIQDWLKYGLLCEFWHRIMKSYDSEDKASLEPSYSQELLTDNK